MKYKIEGFLDDREDIHTEIYIRYDNKLRQLRSFYNISEPLIQHAYKNIKSYHDFQKANFLDKIAVNVDTKEIKILEYELVDLIDKEKKKYLRDHQEFPDTLIMLIIIFSTSLFEFYIDEVMTKIFMENAKKFRYIYKKLEHIKKQLNKIPEELSYYDMNITEIIAIRNVLVHNNGKVDAQFIKQVKNSEYKIGDKIILNKDIMHGVINTLHNYMTLLDREIK